MDSTICEVYGLQRQGIGFGYTEVRGYPPLLATRAGAGEVMHSRLRGWSANTGRGVARFLGETFTRVRQPEVTGLLVMRADCGCYSHDTIATWRKHGVRLSVTARMAKDLHKVISAVPEEARTPITYWSSTCAFGLDEQAEPISGAVVAPREVTQSGNRSAFSFPCHRAWDQPRKLLRCAPGPTPDCR
jgi:hypothetical protein